jgi:hypothetical protein
MKIIRPMDLTADGVVSSNALGDGYQPWEPEGRSNSFSGAGSVSVGGNLGFCVPSGSFVRSFDIYDLDSGEKIGEFSDESVFNIVEIAASPDGSLVAYRGAATLIGNPYVKVYDVSSSQVVYSRDANPTPSRLNWSPDSGEIIFYEYKPSGLSTLPPELRCVRVNASNWGATILSEDLLDLAGITITEGASLSLAPPKIAASGEAFLSFRAEDDGDSNTLVVRLSSSMAATHAESVFGSPNPEVILANDTRSEVAVFFGDGDARFFAYADMAPISAPAAISGTTYKGVSASLDGSEVTLQASSVQPYNRRFLLSDYSALPPMPATGNYKIIHYATDYFLGVNSNGSYDIVDLTTNTLITQINPTVTAGDIYTYANHNYEALQDNNDRPDLGTLKVDPETLKPAPTWLDLGFINPLRMFDNKLDSKTTAPSPLVIDVTPGMLVNGLALFSVDAATVQITYTDPDDGLVYDTGEISMLDNSGVQDWYGFFFDPYLVKADLARVDLPAYIDGTIQITLDGAGADVAIGEVVLGTIYQIGDAQYGSSAGIIDFSRKEADQFGNFEIVPRRFSKRAEFDAVIPPAYGGSVQRTLARLRATPIVWIGSVDLEETIVYGYFREFDILLSNPAFSNVTITVEGL